MLKLKSKRSANIAHSISIDIYSSYKLITNYLKLISPLRQLGKDICESASALGPRRKNNVLGIGKKCNIMQLMCINIGPLYTDDCVKYQQLVLLVSCCSFIYKMMQTLELIIDFGIYSNFSVAQDSS